MRGMVARTFRTPAAPLAAISVDSDDKFVGSNEPRRPSGPAIRARIRLRLAWQSACTARLRHVHFP